MSTLASAKSTTIYFSPSIKMIRKFFVQVSNVSKLVDDDRYFCCVKRWVLIVIIMKCIFKIIFLVYIFLRYCSCSFPQCSPTISEDSLVIDQVFQGDI